MLYRRDIDMLMQEVTPEMIEQWKLVFKEYKPKLKPNRKTALDMIGYLKNKYSLIEVKDEKWESVVVNNVLYNQCFAEKLPTGKQPTAVVFSVDNIGEGKHLYENQDEVFRGLIIHVGVELETGFFHVEGSSNLWDELFAFRGLDERDSDNFYLVAQYIYCLRRFGILDDILKQTN